MPKNPSETKKKGVLAAVALIVLLAAAGGGLYFWLMKDKVSISQLPLFKKPPAETGQSPPAEIRGAIPKEPDNRVIDYGQLEEDQKLKDFIRERKEQYGFDQGVDMILRADESLKVGEATIPMKEILEKIRVQKGDFLEADISDKPDSITPEERKKRLEQKIDQTRVRVAELENILENPAAVADDTEAARLRDEYDRLKEIIQDHETLQETVRAISELEKKIQNAAESEKESYLAKIRELENTQENLAQKLAKALMPEQNGDAFGIHVVKPGDNIWNLHFTFLKEYFAGRGISIAPKADEPTRNGRSTGVGKLLKFSENIVYIYNVRERKLDVNLNVIHPMSKIVVFHMEEIFSLLEGIDLKNVNRIRFDGENIWLPAEN